MPSYKYNGKTYDIPADKAADFEAKYQDARMAYKDGDTVYDIPVSKREQFLSKFPNAIQWDDQTQKDTLETNLADFSAQYGDFMTEYELFEKHQKAPEMEPEYLPNYESHMAQADEYNLRRSERERMLKEYFSNPLVIKEREGRAGDARVMAESFAAAAGRMEQENPELAKKAAKFSMSMIPGRGPLVLDDQTRQYREDHANYETARRFAEEAQEVYAAPSKNDDSVGVVNFLRGAKNVANSADFWTMGMSGIADNLNARDALAKVQEKLGGIDNLTEDNISQVLSPSETALVTAWAANVDAQARRAEDLSRGYQAGQGATESLGFMAQFLLTGGVGKAAAEGATKGLTKWLAGQLGKMSAGAVKSVAKGTAKGVLGTVKSLTKAAVQTPFMPATYNNISEVMLEIDNSGKLIEADKAFWNGLADSMIETWSENAGGMVEEILGIPLKLGKGALNKALGDTAFGKWGQSLTRTPAYNLMKQAGWNGYIGELGEEWLGNSVRTLTGLDPDALKDFATVDQQIITMTSFAPMAVFGFGASTAQYTAAKNRAANAAEALSGIMKEAGYTDDQIAFTLDDINASTPRQLSETLTPVVNQIARDTGFGSDAFKAAMKYADAMAKYRTLDGFYQREQESKMLDARTEIESNTGQLFYQIRDTGKPSVTGDDNVYIEEVRVVENSDGSRYFVVGQSEDGTLAIVDEQGGKRFITEDEITQKLNDGSITSDRTMMLHDFLSAEVVRKKQDSEQIRMAEDARNAVNQIKEIAQQGVQVNVGTVEAPVPGVVLEQKPDGIIVQTEAGVSQLSWEEAGRILGVDATPRTDDEIEAGEVAEIEAAHAERETRLAQTTDEAASAEIEAIDAQAEERVADPLPLKQDGSVDQTTLWNQNPERWAEWNDEQRQDGGVNSLGYINAAITREKSKVDKLTKAYDAEPDFDVRASMEPRIKEASERINRLVALQQKYAPLMQAEAQQVAEGSEQAEPVVVNKDRERSVESVVAALYDKGLDDAEVSANIDANIEEYEKKLAAQSKRAPKMGSDADAYLQKKQKYQEKMDEIQQELNFWASVRQAISGLRENEMQVPEVPGAVGMEKDPEPQNAVEFAARELGLKEGGIKLQRKSFAEHTGYGNEEMKKFFGLFKSKQDGGMTVEQAGERLMEIDRENNTGFFDQDDPNAGLDAILDALSANKTIGELRSYTARRRQEEAQQEADAAYSAMMADYEAAYGMSVEEVADYNAVMRSELIQKGLNETEYNELNSIFAEEISEYDTRTEEAFGRSDGEVPSDVEGGSDAIPEGSSNVLQPQQSDYISGEGTAPEGEQSSEDVGDLYAQDGTSQVQPAAVESSLDEDMPDFLGMSDEDVVRRATEELTTEQERASLEEEKRATLRDRIKEWEQKLGVQVDVMESVDDVTNAQAKQQILNGREVFGWFEVASGKVAFYLPDYVSLPTANGLSEIDKTYIHEVVSHRGLRGLLGEEKYGELCDMVWDAMTEEQKTKFLNYPGVNGNTRAAADEFIAHFAENVDYNDNRTLWDKIVDFIKGLFNSVELPVHISNESLADLLRMSYSRLAKNAAAVDTDSNQQAEGNTMFRAEDGSLVGMHNISEGKLRKAIKQGGLANPSTAVVNIAEYSLEEYGDISLIMPSSLVDSETGDNIGTYTGDAWTPTYPIISRQIDDAGWRVVKDRIRAAVGESDDLYREIVNSVDNYLSDDRNSRLEFVFLKEKGIDPKIELKGADGFVGMRNLEAILGIEGLRDGMESYEKYKAASPMAKRSFNTWQRVDGDKKAHKALKDELRQNPEFAKLMGLGDDLTFAQFDSFTYDIFRKEYDAGNINTTDTLDGASRYVDANDMRTEFDTWLESLMQEAGAKEVFFAGWTRDGDRIYKDNTLENVSRHMRMQGRTNAYDDHGLSATKSTLLQRLTSLADIRKNRARLQDEASYNKAYDELEERLYSVISQLADMEKISDNPFMNIDYAEARLQEAIVKRDPIAYLNSEYGYNIDAKGEYAEELKSFIKDVQNMPAKYFETKFERPVYLNEFAAVVMPTTTSEDIKQAVSESGLPIFEYDSTVEGSRKEATMKATEEEGIRFRTRITPEMDKAYMDAVEAGDMETAQRMVDEAARLAGYDSNSDYQGSLAFNGAAPSGYAYYDTKEERIEAWENGNMEDDQTLGDYKDAGIDISNLGWSLTSPVAQRMGNDYTRESIKNLADAVNNDSRKIKVYRAVDADIKEDSVRNGDWVTPSRAYAEHHIRLQDWKEGRIIEQEVDIDDIWWDGNDINEWGYNDGQGYAYKNTSNNRKLLAPVTYDDNGNVIPLSERFNPENEDIRFRVTEDGKPIFNLQSRINVPKVRGGWTEAKILRYLKQHGSREGVRTASMAIAQFDSVEELKEHMFYHGSQGGAGVLKPSITMSDREIERIGGGGYGDKYWGISVSKSKEIASRFSSGSSVRVYPIILLKDAKVIERPDFSDAWDAGEHIVELWNEGVDAVWIGNGKQGGGEQELLVLNPRAIVNINTADFYRYYKLGSAENPLRIADDEAIEKMYATAKEYASTYQPRKPIRPMKPWAPSRIDDNLNRKSEDQYQSEVEEYNRALEQYERDMQAYEDALKVYNESDEKKAFNVLEAKARQDIRFRFIGKKGAANLDKAEEATKRLDNLAVAKKMEKAGKDARSIKFATGWERGADRLWRYEEPDFWIDGQGEDYLDQPTERKSLSEYVDKYDWEYFVKAYPELSDLQIEITEFDGYGGGYYDPFEHLIVLRPSNGHEFNKGGIMHEVQHAIQEVEGFASGTHPEIFTDGWLYGLNTDTLLHALRIREQAEAEVAVGRYKRIGNAINHAAKVYDYLAGESVDKDESVEVAKYRDSNELYKFIVSGKKDAERKYFRTAGEVEARNVEDRYKRGWGNGEYLYHLAEETEDVARKDQIFLEDALTVAMPSDIRFRMSNENQVIFVSNAARAVEGIKQEKATPEQWLKMLEKAGGLKAGEDKWMGLSDWLKASDKKTLTKQEVLDFINENMIIIEEERYSDIAYENLIDAENETRETLQSIFDEYVSESQDMNDDIFMSTHYDYAIEKLANDLNYYAWNAPFINNSALIELDYSGIDDLNSLRNRLGLTNINHDKQIEEVRLGYVTSGLRNNREIALIIPTIEPWGEEDATHFGDAGEGRAVAWIRFGETEVTEEGSLMDYEPKNDVEREIKDYIELGMTKWGYPFEECVGYAYNQITDAPSESVGWTEEAVTAVADGMRGTARTRKILVIDEIQSKRHQEGRERGYISKEKERELREKFEKAKERFFALDESLREKYGSDFANAESNDEYMEILSPEDYREYMNAQMDFSDARLEMNNPRYDAVPDAPFDKNWHELAMKRMLRYAAENGYDVIAWTKGDQQAERYNIGNVVRNITADGDWYDTNSNNPVDGKRARNLYIRLQNRGVLTYAVNEDGIIINGDYTGTPLANVVGKEMAIKLINAEPYEEFDAEDMHIGGEGMKGFYDKMLPAFMNKYGKKWGVKVEDIELPNLEDGLTMHSVPVTEEMKASVMEGQVMFRMRGENESAEEFHRAIVDEHKSKYNDIAEIEVFPVNEATAKRFGYTLDELRKLSGLYVSSEDLIAIFAKEDETDSTEIEDTIFHESVHKLADYFDHLKEVGEWMWNVADNYTIFAELKKYLEQEYEEGEYAEEMMCHMLGYTMSSGRVDELLSSMPESVKKNCEQIFNEIGYDRTRESIARVLGYNGESAEVSEVASEESGADEGRRSRKETKESTGGYGSEIGYDRRAEESHRSNGTKLSYSGDAVNYRISEAEGLQESEESAEETRFRTTEITPEVRDEMAVIAATALVNGNYMKAPNGADTNLTAEQWAMVRTKNFKKWFGEWENDPENASKVVDENGEPLVIWRGMSFDLLKEPEAVMSENSYFSDKEKVARIFGKNVGSYFMNSVNPYIVSARGENWSTIPMSFVEDLEIEPYDSEYPEYTSVGDIASAAFEKGYDAVWVQDVEDENGVADQFVNFKSEQIKSATDNTGEFSEGEGDIRYRINENPTEAQKEAGNYKMGHLNLDGYRITIENPKGSVRRGTDSKGNAWENTLNNDYGYIRGTEGVDGDHIDVYLSDNPSEGNVFVIDQVNPETREFDEHKVMYGFSSADEAREAYLANFSEGWNGLGTITEVSKDEFKKWIQSSHRKTKPFSEYKSVRAIGAQSEGEEVEDDLLPVTGTPTEEVVASGLMLSLQDFTRLAGDIFEGLPSEYRTIVGNAFVNGADLQQEIFRIPSRFVEKQGLTDEDIELAKMIADKVQSAVISSGIELSRPLTTNEALWMLDRSINPPVDVFGHARTAVVADNLGFSPAMIEQMEYDLMSILKWKNNDSEKPDIYGTQYYHELVELLENIACIELGFLEKVITDEGKRLIKQGFVIYDYYTPKTLEKRKIQRERLSLFIGFLGVIVGIAAMFFPRHDTLSQTDPEFREFNGVVIHDTINLAPQADEISQATDSTK